MKERALVAFTLLAQTAIGAFWSLGALYLLTRPGSGADTAREWAGRGFLTVAALMGLAVVASLTHLGSPLLAWRALCNVRSSWLSREVWSAVLFGAASAAFAGLLEFEWGGLLLRRIVFWAAALLGLALLLSMSWAYRLRTVPAWNNWATPLSFLLTTLLLGGLGAGLEVELFSGGGLLLPVVRGMAGGTIVLLSAEFLLLPLWLAGLAGREGAAGRAVERLTGRWGGLFRARLLLMILGVLLAGLLLTPLAPRTPLRLLPLFLVVLTAEGIGRVLFYRAYEREGSI